MFLLHQVEALLSRTHQFTGTRKHHHTFAQRRYMVWYLPSFRDACLCNLGVSRRPVQVFTFILVSCWLWFHLYVKDQCGLVDMNLTQLCQVPCQLRNPDSVTQLTEFYEFGCPLIHRYRSWRSSYLLPWRLGFTSPSLQFWCIVE